MRDFPPSAHGASGRSKILSELYLRAYWRYYLLTVTWVVAVTIVLPGLVAAR